MTTEEDIYKYKIVGKSAVFHPSLFYPGEKTIFVKEALQQKIDILTSSDVSPRLKKAIPLLKKALREIILWRRPR